MHRTVRLTSTSLPQRQVLIPISIMPSKQITNIKLDTASPEVKNIHRIHTAMYMERIAQQQNHTNDDRLTYCPKSQNPLLGYFRKTLTVKLQTKTKRLIYGLWLSLRLRESTP